MGTYLRYEKHMCMYLFTDCSLVKYTKIALMNFEILSTIIAFYPGCFDLLLYVMINSKFPSRKLNASIISSEQ